MDKKYNNGGEAEVITKLVMTPVSRKNPRWLTVSLGVFLSFNGSMHMGGAGSIGYEA